MELDANVYTTEEHCIKLDKVISPLLIVPFLCFSLVAHDATNADVVNNNPCVSFHPV